MSKKSGLEREFDAFFGDLPLRALTLDDTARFRESWKMSNISARKRIERLRSFFKFCVERGWIEKNPQRAGRSYRKREPLPTFPFTASEWEKIRWAIGLYPDRPKGRRQVLVLILLLRHTGLRIRDAVCMERTRGCKAASSSLHAKDRRSVLLPLHNDVLHAIAELPPGRHFFWSGMANPKDWPSLQADYPHAKNPNETGLPIV